ncbi:MAG: UPF0758 domain-containing protein [Clostridia bacterium]
MNSNKPLTMKELPLSERPYEKLETLGASPQLTDAELLAVILKSGACGEKGDRPGKTTVGVCRAGAGIGSASLRLASHEFQTGCIAFGDWAESKSFN